MSRAWFLSLSFPLLVAACHSSSHHPSDGGVPNDGAMPTDDGGLPTTAWQAARIQSPIAYTSPEHVIAYASSFATPQIVAGAGQVVYPSFYADGSWQVVVQSLDGSSKKTLLESASVPGLTFSAMLSVPEAHGVLVLLGAAQPLQSSRLVFVPLDGSTSVIVDTGVQAAQVSADGTRVSYVALTSPSSTASVIKTSTILSPAPQMLGALDVGSEFAYAENPISRSTSTASNTPFFYLVTGYEADGETVHARPFGTAPSSAPASILSDADFTAVGDFGSVTMSQNGRFVAVRGYSDASWTDLQTGVTTVGSVTFSPDSTHFLVSGSSSFTLYRQDGTKNVLTSPGSDGAVWSSDSSLIALTSNGSPDCAFGIVDVATGALTSHTSPGCVASDQSVFGFTADDKSLLTRDNRTYAYKISTVEIATGTAHVLSQGTSNDVDGSLFPEVSNGTAAIADTGDGIVFCDDWAAVYAHYDGTGRVRLDTPRTGEVALDSTHRIVDVYAGVTGLFAWDATSKRVLFEPVMQANEAMSVLEPNHSLASASLQGGAATPLLGGTKPFGQVKGFEENFRIEEAFGVVLFNSANGGIAQDIMPATLSVGSLTGGSAVQLSPTLPSTPGAIFGPGTMYSVGRVYGTNGVAKGVLYDSYDPSYDLSESAVAMDGTSQASLTGMRLRGIAPDGSFAVLSDTSNAAYTVSLPIDGSSQPKLVSGTYTIQSPSVCFGCNGSSAWTYTDGAVTITADDKLVLLATPSGSSTASTYVVDPSVATPTPTDLAVTNLVLLGDGLTAVANAADGTIVTFAVSTPMQKTTYAVGTFAAATSDGSYLAYTAGTSSAPTLSAEHTTDKSIVNLLPTSLATGGQLYSVTQSSDGKRISFAYQTHTTPAPNDACNGYATTMVLEGIDGSSPTIYPVPCTTATEPAPSGDFSALLYVDSGALYAVSGTATPVKISAADEQVAAFYVAPISNRIFVRALTSAGTWQYESVHADGTMRVALGDALPVQKRLFDLKFYKNGTAIVVDTDAITDGVLELYRFDLP